MQTRESAAWQAAEHAAELERLRRIRVIPLVERLRELESLSKFLSLIRERHQARDALAQK